MLCTLGTLHWRLITLLGSSAMYFGTAGGATCCNAGGSTSFLFDQMLKHRNDAACPANGFYTYEVFIAAANAFSGFGTIGDVATQKREIAAFLAETTGGWASAPDVPYAWGYCYKQQEQGNPGDYCVQSTQWPCAAVKKYYGRGPIQISYNHNYDSAGQAINSDLINNPDLVATDPTISFKTALWLWMTAQSPKPSCQSAADQSAGRVASYGVLTNIINGGVECDILGVSYGNNLDCYSQQPFG